MPIDLQSITFESNYTQYHAVIEKYILNQPLQSIGLARRLFSLIRLDLRQLAVTQPPTPINQYDLLGLADFADLYNNEFSTVYPHHVAEFQKLFIKMLNDYLAEVGALTAAELQCRIAEQDSRIAHVQIQATTQLATQQAAVDSIIDPALSAAELSDMLDLELHINTRKPEAEICILASKIHTHLQTCLYYLENNVKDDIVQEIFPRLHIDILILHSRLQIQNQFTHSLEPDNTYNYQQLVQDLQAHLRNILKLFDGSSLPLNTFWELNAPDKEYIIDNPDLLSDDLPFLKDNELKFCISAMRFLSLFEHDISVDPAEIRALLELHFGDSRTATLVLSQDILQKLYDIIKDGTFSCDFLRDCPAHTFSWIMMGPTFHTLVANHFLSTERLKNISYFECLRLCIASTHLIKIMEGHMFDFRDLQQLSFESITQLSNLAHKFSDFCNATEITMQQLLSFDCEIFEYILQNPDVLTRLQIWLNYYFKSKDEFFALTLAKIQRISKVTLCFLPGIIAKPSSVTEPQITAALNPHITQLEQNLHFLVAYGHMLNIKKIHASARNIVEQLLSLGLNFHLCRAIYETFISCNAAFAQQYFVLLQDFARDKNAIFALYLDAPPQLNTISNFCDATICAEITTVFNRYLAAQNSCLQQTHARLCDPTDKIHAVDNILQGFNLADDVIAYITRNTSGLSNDNFTNQHLLGAYGILQRKDPIPLVGNDNWHAHAQDWAHEINAATTPAEMHTLCKESPSTQDYHPFLNFYTCIYYFLGACELYKKAAPNYCSPATIPCNGISKAIAEHDTAKIKLYLGTSLSRWTSPPSVLVYDHFGQSFFTAAQSCGSQEIATAFNNAIRDIKRGELQAFIRQHHFNLTNLNEANADQETPLTRSIKDKNRSMLPILLAFGADASLANGKGEQPLQLALDVGLVTMVNDLLVGVGTVNSCRRMNVLTM